MKHVLNAALTAGVLSLTLLSGSVQAQAADDHAAHAHEHADADAGTLTRDGDKPWETDAPLRRGMTEIRVASAMLAPAYGARQMSAAQGQQLSEALRGSVATMIAQCQLAPAADANLHIILGQILAAASALESDPLSAQGLPAITAALADYGHYFNHPGWLDGESEDGHDHAH